MTRCSKVTPSSGPVPCFLTTIAASNRRQCRAACAARHRGGVRSSDTGPEPVPASIIARAIVRPPIAEMRATPIDRIALNAAGRSAGRSIGIDVIHGRRASSSRIRMIQSGVVITITGSSGTFRSSVSSKVSLPSVATICIGCRGRCSERRSSTSSGCHTEKIDAAATNRFRPREHAVRGDPRQPLVDQMLVGLAAAERRWIPRTGVAVRRLNEHEAGGRQIRSRTGVRKKSPSNFSRVHRLPIA